jgi:phosphonate transport system permease protein
MSTPIPTKSSPRLPWLAGLLSLFIPGAGQIYAGNPYRGVGVFIGVLVMAITVGWYGKATWYIVPVVIWLWNIWDATTLAITDKGRNILLPIVVGLIAAYGIGWQVLQIDLKQASAERAIQIIKPMLNPDFVEPRREKNSVWVEIQVPCSTQPPMARNEMNGVTVFATPDCARVGETLLLNLTGLWQNWDTQIWWQTPIGDPKMMGGNEDAMLVVKTDDKGSLTTSIRVPSTTLVAMPDPTLPLIHRVFFDQYRDIGGITLSENGRYGLKGIFETIAMALIATSLAILIAVPISFLAARNLMTGNPFTSVIYVIVRTILNIVRSIESLIIAIVFVVIVGLGPFAGVLAIAVHSVAALAKLYSEVIEGIDPGPIEAIRATGASWVQVVRYGVIPQIVPPFIAFTIYRWDINVRSSTIIGFVGGGGIGFYLIQWIQINDLRAVSMAFIVIAVVVVILDYISAHVRERLV